MARPGVLFRFELLDALEQLDPADAGLLLLGAMRYGKDETPPTFQNPLLSVIWPLIKTAVDRDAEAYDSKILQKKYAVYVREAKKAGHDPMDFDAWKASTDITSYHPISDDIHNQDHSQYQYHNHSQNQEQEHTQEDPAAAPPPLARDSRSIVFLDDGQYKALVADLGEQELGRCVSYLSEYCSTHGKSYRDWPTMIRKASREGWGLSSPSSGSKGNTDFQPSLERVQKSNERLDAFLAEQEGKSKWNLSGITRL